jgi:hypothetical protein
MSVDEFPPRMKPTNFSADQIAEKMNENNAAVG